ncbi:hypothetical protein F4814DRAFT_395618 [Daldinia grandis]|nr:hypothetical protein F4814DRAFT_395618 [Daldinia grandis]
MDWPKESIGISKYDINNVFKYAPKESSVLQLKGPEKEVVIRSHKTDGNWIQWVDEELPSPDSLESGLILVLARRVAEDEKKPFPGTGGRRNVRTLPFSKDTFELISERLYLHGSIAQVVNRSDVPHFSFTRVDAKLSTGQICPAYVYNCRSTNEWGMDLALTATHFPLSGLTYAILFGCTIPMEEDITRRLNYCGVEASYPLLLPGIFAELERSRHLAIVEKHMDKIEEKIFELDYQPSIEQQMHLADRKARNQDKRSQWLETTYLKDALITWNVELSKMAKHTKELGSTLFLPWDATYPRTNDIDSYYTHYLDTTTPTRASTPVEGTPSTVASTLVEIGYRDTRKSYMDVERCFEFAANGPSHEAESYKHKMTLFGAKVNNRLQTIIQEYENKIRECTMRIKGMEMATQWSREDTNLQIALITGRDSRYMRYIAVVTMVFLPGTFCAGIFSMQFFNWTPSGDSDTVVSPYFWIYVLVTLVTTTLTLGIWYFALWRGKQRKLASKEVSLA